MAFKNLIGALFGGAAALATAACDEGPTTVTHFTHDGGNWEFLVYAANKGPVWIDIHGNPFEAADADVDQAVEAAMTRAITKRRFTYTTEKDRAGAPDHRVILLFFPPSDREPGRFCEGDIPAVDHKMAPGEVLSVVAVFCHRGQKRAIVSGRIKNVAAPGDQMFGELIAQMTRDLFQEQKNW